MLLCEVEPLRGQCEGTVGPASLNMCFGQPNEAQRLIGLELHRSSPLDRLLESYKRGADLLSFCRSRLEAVEEQVKVLEHGQLKPWSAA